MSSPTILKIAIVGDGLLGLTASIALRQAGHDVHIYPSATPEDVYRGVTHIPPNANSVLQQLGVSHSASVVEELRHVNTSGDCVDAVDMNRHSRSWQQPWLITQWGNLISHLKDAIQSVGPGTPAHIRNDGPVARIDEENSSLVLENGGTVVFDLVLDAKKSTFTAHDGGMDSPKATRTQAALKLSSPWAAAGSQVFTSADGRVVAVNKSLGGSDMTFIGFPALRPDHPDLREALLQQLDGFCQSVHDAVSNSSNGDISVYSSDAKDGTILLPCDIQYAAMSIEDGASLGVMLGHLSTKDEIRQRLELHAQTRAQRTMETAKLSRQLWNDLQHGKLSTQYVYLGFSHDEAHHSTQALRQHNWATTPRLSWRQPVGFGPMTSPRQNVTHQSLSNPREDRLEGATSLTASIRFRTSATLLRNIFPKETYSFVEPDTVAEASYVFQEIKNLSWLGGGGYNLVLFQIHGVQHTSPVDGRVRQGSYVALVLEDLTDPILSGREDLGWPKLYSDIDAKDGTHSGGGCFSVSMSWRGTQWASFTWGELEAFQHPAQPAPGGAAEHVFVHKYIPATVDTPSRAAADADYDVMMPPASPASAPVKWEHAATKPQINISGGLEESLPTLWHITERLAELPVFEVVDAKVGRKSGQDDFSGATRV